MTKKNNVFRCDHCGAIVAVLKGGDGEFACCDSKMNEVTPKEGKRLIYNLQRPGTP